MKIILKRNVLPGQEVWTGIPGRYESVPENWKGVYNFIEIAHRNEEGNLIHDYFDFEKVDEA